MSTRGIEAGLSARADQHARSSSGRCARRTSTTCSTSTSCSVPAFAAPDSFGVSYGRNRIAVGTRPTYIWGNVPFSCINTTDASGQLVVGTTGADGKPCHRIYPGDAAIAGSTVRDSIIADANPRSARRRSSTRSASRPFTITALVDWRVAGYTSDMTKNLCDEGGNSRDYDDAVARRRARRSASSATARSAPATSRRTSTSARYLKLREVNVSFQAPKRWADSPARATCASRSRAATSG